MSKQGIETPPKPLPTAYITEDAETPGPYRARISNLRAQVAKLVKESQQDRRRYQAELAERDGQIAQLQAGAKDAQLWRRLAEDKAEELKMMKEAGESMREELNAYSLIAQEKALLALANEQLRMVEMEQRLLQARAASLMRDHKISLFKAREDDLNAELAEKDAQLQDLEAALGEANTSLAHQRAAEAKSSHLAASSTQNDLDEALRKAATYENKVAGLETKLAAAKQREEDLVQELENVSNESKASASDNEKRELQKALRAAKSDATKREEEVTDLKEELAALKQSSKEREEKWKAKAKEAIAERDRLADVEEELKAVKRAKPSPKKVDKQPSKARKAATSDDSDAGPEAPKKKSKKESPKRKVQTNDSDSDVPSKPEKVMAKSTKVNSAVVPPSRKLADSDKTTSSAKTKSKLGEDENDKPEPEKKKKRKLGLSKPAFQWDPILSSGDGVIPTTLSPARPPDRNARGAVPYAGFGAATSRGISRFQ